MAGRKGALVEILFEVDIMYVVKAMNEGEK
jgi:hypothetical protein